MPAKRIKPAKKKGTMPKSVVTYKKGGAKKSNKNFIQKAIKKPGSLRATAKRAGAMKADGTIKKSWLREKAKGKGKTAQRARLAITLGKMKK
jgi:hypothetical protein